MSGEGEGRPEPREVVVLPSVHGNEVCVDLTGLSPEVVGVVLTRLQRQYRATRLEFDNVTNEETGEVTPWAILHVPPESLTDWRDTGSGPGWSPEQ